MSGDELTAALLSVASRFQTVDVCTEEGRNMWSFRTLNQRGKGMDAIRFKVPPGTKTHLYWGFAAPNVQEFYIIPLQGQMAGFEQWFDGSLVKYRLPPILNRNLVLQDLPHRLEPGGEYLLWFRIDSKKPVMFACSIVLLDDDRPSSQENIESAIGLSDVNKQAAQP